MQSLLPPKTTDMEFDEATIGVTSVPIDTKGLGSALRLNKKGLASHLFLHRGMQASRCEPPKAFRRGVVPFSVDAGGFPIINVLPMDCAGEMSFAIALDQAARFFLPSSNPKEGYFDNVRIFSSLLPVDNRDGTICTASTLSLPVLARNKIVGVAIITKWSASGGEDLADRMSRTEQLSRNVLFEVMRNLGGEEQAALDISKFVDSNEMNAPVLLMRDLLEESSNACALLAPAPHPLVMSCPAIVSPSSTSSSSLCHLTHAPCLSCVIATHDI